MTKAILAITAALVLTGCQRAPQPLAALPAPAVAVQARQEAPTLDETAYTPVDVEEARRLMRGARFARNWNPSRDERMLADMAGDKIRLEGVLDVRQDESILSTTVEAILVPPQGQTLPVMVKEYKTRRYARALAARIPVNEPVTVFLTVQYRPQVFDFHPFRLDAVKLQDGTLLEF